MFKYQILDDFIEQYKNLPEQGSDEWKQSRQNFIGGSEIATVIKQNKNKSVNKLIMEKLGFDRFQGNVITHWGNVFEELIRLHCEEQFKCTIRETGSIPYKHGSLSYSPDGLAVVPTNALQKKFESLPNQLLESPAQLVLFEFKCPHSRIATSEIPQHYQPQVNIGMNIIDIMETAIFVQATYRRCAFNQLRYDKQYNSYGHYKKLDLTTNPLECGFMIIYADEESDYTDDLKTVLTEICSATELVVDDDVVLDLGYVNDPSVFEEVLENCVKKTFKINYGFRYTYDERIFDGDSYNTEMYNESIKYRAEKSLKEYIIANPTQCVIGVLPFKLLDVCMTHVPKNSSYIQDTDAHNKAIAVLNCIKDHQDINCKEDVAKSVRKYKL